MPIGNFSPHQFATRAFSGRTFSSRRFSGGATNAAGNSPTIVGYNSGGATGPGTTDPLNNGLVLVSARFTAPFAGSISQIEIFSTNPSNALLDVALGVYTTSGGVPNTPVAAFTQLADVGTWGGGGGTWKAFAVTPISISAGADFWFAIEVDQSSAMTLYYDTLSNSAYYATGHTFGNAWPNTPGNVLAAKYGFRGTLA